MSLRAQNRCPCGTHRYGGPHDRTDCPFYGLPNYMPNFNSIFSDPDHVPDRWERWMRFADPKTMDDLCGPFGRPMPTGNDYRITTINPFRSVIRKYAGSIELGDVVYEIGDGYVAAIPKQKHR